MGDRSLEAFSHSPIPVSLCLLLICDKRESSGMFSCGQGLCVEAQVIKQPFTKLSESLNPNPLFVLSTRFCKVFCHSEKQNKKARNQNIKPI